MLVIKHKLFLGKIFEWSVNLYSETASRQVYSMELVEISEANTKLDSHNISSTYHTSIQYVLERKEDLNLNVVWEECSIFPSGIKTPRLNYKHVRRVG